MSDRNGIRSTAEGQTLIVPCGLPSVPKAEVGIPLKNKRKAHIFVGYKKKYAVEWIRTTTVLLPPAPQAGALPRLRRMVPAVKHLEDGASAPVAIGSKPTRPSDGAQASRQVNDDSFPGLLAMLFGYYTCGTPQPDCLRRLLEFAE